jgi:proteasome lid subunit RPN8/RPN11
MSQSFYIQMLEHVQSTAPEEACGLVAGIDNLATKVYSVSNELHSPTRFRMDSGEQIRLCLEMERQGLDLLAIYHSHPKGPGHPSVTDQAEFAYPGVITLIWYPSATGWECRAYWIDDGAVTEADFQRHEFE